MQESPILGQSLTLLPQSTTSALESTDSCTSTTSPPTVGHLFSSTTSSSSINLPSTSYNSLLTSIPVPAKRGHKEHVASACTNCKKAHLACDVSRPCKRCVSLGKTETCLDIKHKKRGRPKLQDKKPVTTTTPITDRYEVLCGTIQTPIITSGSNSNNDTPIIPFTYTNTEQTSFHHQPIEAFQQVHIDSKPTKDTHQLTPIILTPSSPAPSMTRSDSTLTTLELPDLSLPSSPTTTTTKVVLILSMEICCAKISNDVTPAWGYYPQELAHRSIYDFIASEDSSRLSQLHRSLLDNVVEATSRKAPPPTERTTSDLFHQKSTDELAIKATGFRSFVDTLHVKTRSGSKELYDICVYVGGGWGANISDPSTLDKLYIVMTCQKTARVEQTKRSISTAYKPIAPLLSSSATSSQQPLNRYSVYRNRPIQPAPHDLRRVSLPAHFANNSKLNTISFRHSQDSPKINVAPMTEQSSSSRPCTYFRPIASASISVSGSVDPQHPSRQKPFTTISYRYTPSTGPRETPTVTHPTTQYFLQTSSATLNAAASAAQDHSRPSTTGSSSEITPSRKQGISIRSLLC